MLFIVVIAALIICAISEKYFDASIPYCSFVKATFKYLILSAKQGSLAVRLVFSPFSFVEGSTFELADSRSMTHVIFECTFINVSVVQPNLSLTVLEIFCKGSYVFTYWEVLDIGELFLHVLDKGCPFAFDSALECIRHLKAIHHLKLRLNIVTSLQLKRCKGDCLLRLV